MKYVVITLSLLVCMFTISRSEAVIISQEEQSIHLQSVGNARELGGYLTTDGRKVKRGVLLRTAALNTISSEDVARLTEEYHLAVIADLRTSIEAASKPDPDIGGVKYINLRVINEDAFDKDVEQKLSMEGDAMQRLKLIVDGGLVSSDMYIKFLSNDYGKKAYREFFRELLALSPERSMLFHCSQGKDRTGCAAMLILSALGVGEDTIMEDYLLTNTFNATKIEAQRKMLLSHGMAESELARYMPALDEVSPEFMTNLFAWLKENYGSALGYIHDALGLSNDDIETLKAKFLE